MELLTQIAEKSQRAADEARRLYCEILLRAESPEEGDDRAMLDAMVILGKSAADLPIDRDILVEWADCEQAKKRLPELLEGEREYRDALSEADQASEAAIQKAKADREARIEALRKQYAPTTGEAVSVRAAVNHDLPRCRRQADAAGLILPGDSNE